MAREFQLEKVDCKICGTAHTLRHGGEFPKYMYGQPFVLNVMTYGMFRGYLKLIGSVKISDTEESSIWCNCGEVFSGQLDRGQVLEPGMYESYHKKGGFLGIGAKHEFRKIEKLPKNFKKLPDPPPGFPAF